jgi:hypothetical protein
MEGQIQQLQKEESMFARMKRKASSAFSSKIEPIPKGGITPQNASDLYSKASSKHQTIHNNKMNQRSHRTWSQKQFKKADLEEAIAEDTMRRVSVVQEDKSRTKLKPGEKWGEDPGPSPVVVAKAQTYASLKGGQAGGRRRKVTRRKRHVSQPRENVVRRLSAENQNAKLPKDVRRPNAASQNVKPLGQSPASLGRSPAADVVAVRSKSDG